MSPLLRRVLAAFAFLVLVSPAAFALQKTVPDTADALRSGIDAITSLHDGTPGTDAPETATRSATAVEIAVLLTVLSLLPAP
jgi:hypothetical protein